MRYKPINVILCKLSVILLLSVFILPHSISAAEKTVRVGYWYLPGYHELDDAGTRSGYGYDYMEKIAACLGWNLQYVGYDKSWAELLAQLENGEIDLLTCATKTPEREQRFDYSDKPLGLSFTVLTVKAGETRFSPEDCRTWNGMRIGMITQSSRNAQFEAFAKSEGFQFTPILYKTYDELADALSSGNIDAIVATNMRRMKNEWVLAKIDPDPIYVIVRKGDQKMLSAINRAQSVLEIDLPLLNETLRQRHYAAENTRPIPLTAKERRFLTQANTQNRVFRTLIRPDSAPLAEYRDGQILGVFNDIATLIAKRSGLQLQIIPLRSRDEYDEILRKGDFDIVFDAWSNHSYAEKNNLYLTEPYLSMPVAMLQLQKRRPDTGNLAAFDNSFVLSGLKKEGKELSKIHFCGSMTEMISEITTGKADGGFMPQMEAEEIIRRNRGFAFKAPLIFGLQNHYALGVKRTMPTELIRILEKAVRSVSEDEIRTVLNQYAVSPDGDFTLNDWIAGNPLKSIGAVSLILLAIIGSLFFVLLSRRRIYRNGKIIAKLPVRFFVVDRQYNILLYNCYDVEGMPEHWKKITDYGDRVMNSLMTNAIKEAFEKGSCSIDYEFNGQRRSAHVERLSHDVVERDAVIWVSQDTEELQLSRDEAKQAEKAKSYFLATMSHEIRTPLNAVIGFSEILKDGTLPPETQKSYLNDISVAGNALLSLINDVLDLSKLESGQMVFTPVETDFPALVKEVSMIFQQCFRDKKLKNIIRINPMPTLLIDKLRMRQILFNLVGNAVKFTEHGHIEFSGSFTPVGDSSGTLCFSIADTGCGISEEDRKRLFQPFVQSNAIRGTQTAHNGTGLGLAIIRRMLERLNGEITLKSEPGKGSTFTVTMREIGYLVKHHVNEPDVSEPLSVSPLISGQVLVVDDISMNLRVTGAMLKKIGVDSVIANSPEAALKCLRENNRITLVLCDLWMPEMNGDELARKIRKLYPARMLKLVALTADTENGETFDMNAFDGILHKPVNVEALRKTVAEFGGQ